MTRTFVAPRARHRAGAAFSLLVMHAQGALAQTDAFEECLLRLMQNAAEDATVGEIRKTCESAKPPLPLPHLRQPAQNPQNRPSTAGWRSRALPTLAPFVITPHKPNYIIYSYNLKDYQDPAPGSPAGDEESYLVQAGIVHQSNGRSGQLSRSWNRVYANFIFERGHFYFGLKPWVRIQESSSNDDNPDIEDYLGYFEFQGVYNRNKNNFGLFFRNTLKDGYRGALQLDWGIPANEHLRAYLQYLYGYGESLIDYNHKVNKLGVGIKLTDWL